MNKKSDELIKLLKKEKRIFIQTHDFPDPDALAAAFGLQFFLKEKGISTIITYGGELQTNPIESMIRKLGMDIHNYETIDFENSDKIIIVDGCKGNNNVANDRGEVVAVIDHHLGKKPENVSYVDIRTDYGSSSTIVCSYIQEHKMTLPPDIATALAIGIHIDTNSFKRGTSHQDILAFSFLYNTIDHALMSSILRNNVLKEDLDVYKKALESIKIIDRFAFFYYPGECAQNLLGILANFFLSVEEVKFVVLCAHRDQKIIFSVRSENPNWNAAFIVKKALKGLGSGGGHKDMAGGRIEKASLFNKKEIYQKFKEQLEEIC